jgi:hypothetical protein
MGEYSPNQRFWLIGENDLVNVEQDLNYNLNRVDYRMRTLVEYMKTDVASVSDSSLVKEVGMKWYKTATNAVWYCHAGLNLISQDPNAAVDTWRTDITFEAGYGSVDSSTNRIGCCIANGMVRLRGKLKLNNFDSLPKNVSTDFMTLPVDAHPTKSRYFFVHGGEGLTQFQTARIFIPAATNPDLRCEFIVYGQAGAPSSNNFLNLNDAYYPISDA